MTFIYKLYTDHLLIYTACNCSAANALCNCNPYGGGFCTGPVCCPSGTYSNGSTCLPCGCSAYSNSSQCDLNGQCPCPLGIQGLKCDACSYMHHNLSAGCPACTCDMPDCNCIQCVCSGKSSVCSADLVDYSKAVMTTDFTTLCNTAALPLDCMGGWVFVSETGQPLPSLLRLDSCPFLLSSTPSQSHDKPSFHLFNAILLPFFNAHFLPYPSIPL